MDIFFHKQDLRLSCRLHNATFPPILKADNAAARTVRLDLLLLQPSIMSMDYISQISHTENVNIS